MQSRQKFMQAMLGMVQRRQEVLQKMPGMVQLLVLSYIQTSQQDELLLLMDRLLMFKEVVTLLHINTVA